MDFSIWPSNERSWDEVSSLATWAEQSGFSGFWYADHFMAQTPDNTPGEGMALEGWTLLTALGMHVPRMELTSMVSPVTIHHPVVLAKRAASLAHVLGERVVLGIGAGWQINEHAAYGFELPEPGPRVDRFEEAIEVVHRLINEDAPSFAGDYYSLSDAHFNPRPKVPILVGTGSPRMMRITARWADRWNTWGDPTERAKRTEVFMAACERVGRDPSSVHRSSQAMIFLVDDDAKAAKVRERAPEGRSLVGGPSELVDLLATYVEAGVDEFAIPDFTLGTSPEQRRDTFARLHAEVLTSFV